MALLFTFCDGKFQHKNQLAIDKNNIIIQFNPKSVMDEDIKAAANERDRFNFLISFYLSPFISDLISYKEWHETNTMHHDVPDYSWAVPTLMRNEHPHAYYIYLKFGKHVDAELMRTLFDKKILSQAELSKFMSEDSRERLLNECADYFQKESKAAERAESTDTNSIYKKERSYRDVSLILLIANMQKKQKVMIYSDLPEQLRVIDLMHRSENSDQHIYDDIYLADTLNTPKDDELEKIAKPRPKFFLFNEFIPQMGTEMDRLKATRAAENAMDREKDMLSVYMKKN